MSYAGETDQRWRGSHAADAADHASYSARAGALQQLRRARCSCVSFPQHSTTAVVECVSESSREEWCLLSYKEEV